jgi:outer membrane protein TolC
MIWGLGGQLVQPLFNSGSKANAKALEAGLEAAQANYTQTVMQTHEALTLTERQYALGSASYLQLRLSRKQAHQTLINTLALRSQRLIITVTLYQSMGGGERS